MPQAIPSRLLRIAGSQNRAVRFVRAMARSILHRLGVVVPVRLSTGDVVFVDLANVVGRTIWLFGDYAPEQPVKRLIESNLAPGDVFLDVGANIGFFSLIASRIVGPSGEVHSFEPLPDAAALLRRTVDGNALTNVVVIEAAVGAQAGDATMAVMKDSAYSHVVEWATGVDAGHGSWHAVAVRTISLDQYVAQALAGPPRLVKMDIEGAEMEALKGAHSLLSDHEGPDVICEVDESRLARFNHTPTDVFDRFLSLGYQALDPETLKPIGVGDLSDHRYNVFFRKRTR